MKLTTSTILKHLFIVLLLFIVTNANAQDDTDNSLTVYSGAVVFDDPQFDSVSLVEFSFSLNRNEFEFFRPEGRQEFIFQNICSG